MEFVSHRVIITSNSPPEMWWKMGLGAMDRRLKPPIGYVFYMGNPGQTEAEYRETLRGGDTSIPGGGGAVGDGGPDGVAVAPDFNRESS